MNFKNAYDYLLNFQSQTSRNTSRIQSSEDSQFLSGQKSCQKNSEQKYRVDNSKQSSRNLFESKSEVKINLGENPFDLASSINYQNLQQSKQNYINQQGLQLLQESNRMDDQYEIKIRTNGPVKEDIMSFLQLLGQVEIRKIENTQDRDFNYRQTKSFHQQH
ncbi:unnamed protein product (macronuclear) [Paramecium tetraurelia]|uniref:Uncharacterized protein n=1 Tax=Paramecium tetraurelia TaxID=5888 RepID=A0DB95_PARTE|nr:uncharacterized protein GSPATT00015206001 [Paramecium tetraurelia]CAK80312.1 unnamed protein product [Paramecium tetraurelia]|eukprot:XP_001447709.1 hypothetical protein (macronuclear) [Paramecium tetraurelia strain d4-2]